MNELHTFTLTDIVGDMSCHPSGLWHPALLASSSASLTALRWEPINVHV